jgi:hypothetical protein
MKTSSNVFLGGQERGCEARLLVKALADLTLFWIQASMGNITMTRSQFAREEALSLSRTVTLKLQLADQGQFRMRLLKVDAANDR